MNHVDNNLIAAFNSHPLLVDDPLARRSGFFIGVWRRLRIQMTVLKVALLEKLDKLVDRTSTRFLHTTPFTPMGWGLKLNRPGYPAEAFGQ